MPVLSAVQTRAVLPQVLQNRRTRTGLLRQVPGSSQTRRQAQATTEPELAYPRWTKLRPPQQACQAAGE
jgi:hypothetical protein